MATAGTASALPSSLLASGRVSPSDKLVIGLIGCNSMGFVDARDMLKMPGVELAAMCDVDQNVLEERAADAVQITGKKKPEFYGDYRKLLERKDIDAVVIGTPDHWHCLPTVHACQAGKDVYVEKPLANSITECNIMLSAARKYNRIVTVGQQQRSGTHWQSAMNFISSGRLGKIRRVNIWANFNYGAGNPPVPDRPVPEGVDYDMWLGPAPKRPFNRNRFHGSWRMFWDYGGGLMTDWGVHLIDMPLWAMNVKSPPKSVSATGGIFAHGDNALETADTQNVLYAMDNFVICWEHNGGIQQGPYDRRFGAAFIGTNGTLIADRSNWEVYVEEDDDGKRMQAPPMQFSDRKSHLNHTEDFVKCVKSREKPAGDIEIGHRAALYAHLGNIAYRTGSRLIYDEKNNTIVDNKEATALLTPHYRKPYQLPEV